jgi:hypothetical protein
MAERDIEQSLVTRHGTVIRDTTPPLTGLSNICLMDEDGGVRWFAELPQSDDSYRDEVALVDEDTITMMSWFGWRCTVSLRDGTIISKTWTH